MMNTARTDGENAQIRPLNESDGEWRDRLWTEEWGSLLMISHSGQHRADELPGFVAVKDGEYAGLLTYFISGSECEIISLNSLVEGKGIGSALIEAVKEAAIENGCKRILVGTTNDNTHALRFYQKLGFSLAALYPGAVAEARRLKPEIPITGNDGIPIRDEIELEMIL